MGWSGGGIGGGGGKMGGGRGELGGGYNGRRKRGGGRGDEGKGKGEAEGGGVKGAAETMAVRFNETNFLQSFFLLFFFCLIRSFHSVPSFFLFFHFLSALLTIKINFLYITPNSALNNSHLSYHSLVLILSFSNDLAGNKTFAALFDFFVEQGKQVQICRIVKIRWRKIRCGLACAW